MKVHQAIEHAKIQGLRAPLQLMGCYDDAPPPTGFGEATPDWYDRTIYNAVYCCDDIEPSWPEWAWE